MQTFIWNYFRLLCTVIDVIIPDKQITLFIVDNRNTTKMCQICSKLIIKTTETLLAPFYGWGSTALRLQDLLRGGILLCVDDVVLVSLLLSLTTFCIWFLSYRCWLWMSKSGWVVGKCLKNSNSLVIMYLPVIEKNNILLFSCAPLSI